MRTVVLKLDTRPAPLTQSDLQLLRFIGMNTFVATQTCLSGWAIDNIVQQ